MNRFTKRIIKIEIQTEPADLEEWRNTPVEELPDWVLTSHIVGRVVSPEEAADMYVDDGFWSKVEALAESIDQD